ncbi:MAG: DUF2279 domain-containing protein [Chitinophagales bacterium]
MTNRIIRLFFLLIVLSNYSGSYALSLKKDKKKPTTTTIIPDFNTPYLIIKDTVHTADSLAVHDDTIFNTKYAIKRVVANYDLIPDTTWQNPNVFIINYDTVFHYDYAPVDPAYAYTGKIKMRKPYSFFRNSEVLNKPRVGLVSGMIAGLYATANAWWSAAWYSQSEREKFHLFNDWGEWNQMDKLGHAYSCYFESKWHYDLYRWAGVKEKNAIWIGMLMGNMWQLSIEVNDGFQKKWGFSWGDIVMNVSGSLLFGIQQYVWHDQKITMKMSAFPVNYNKYNDPMVKARADKLYGTSFTESLLKDYNGITFWWSVSPGAFIKNPKSKFPKCLQVSFGYGASGMLGGYKNIWDKNNLSSDDLENVNPADIVDRTDIQRLHRFYFSFDIDWTKLPVKKHWAKGLMKVLNIIKLPAPAIEFNNNKTGSKVAWHWLKF